jgi:hypothetical protein
MVSLAAPVGAGNLGGRMGWPMRSSIFVEGQGWGQGGKPYPMGLVTSKMRAVACVGCTRYVHVLCLTLVVDEFVHLSGLKWARQGALGSREYPN